MGLVCAKSGSPFSRGCYSKLPPFIYSFFLLHQIPLQPIICRGRPHSYSLDLQIKLTKCAFCLHNFVRRHDTFENDVEFDGLTEKELKQLAADMVETEGDKYEALLADAVGQEDQPAGVGGETGAEWRDRIGQQMWVDYQTELSNRGLI